MAQESPETEFRRALDLQRLGRFDESLVIYDRALSRQPANPEALYYRGNALRGLGRLSEAVASYDRALALRPAFAEALNNRGNALQSLDRLQEALASYDRALALRPDHADTLNSRGAALQRLQRLDEALVSFDRALALRPGYAEALFNRGIVLQELNRLDEALASYDEALVRRPDYPEALNNRGNTLQSLDRPEEALASFDRALALNPGFAGALNNRGNSLLSLKRPAEALASFDRALALRPDDAAALHNRGNALESLDRPEEALASFDRALALRPEYADALNNRGNALRTLNRPREALASFDRALAIRPDYPDAHWNSGLASLLLGDFARGWPEYEWRWQVPALRQPVRPFGQPRWHGAEPLVGRTIFVYAEQGLGDTIHFCRYARLLAARGARVVLEVQPALKALLKELAGVHTLISRGEALPEFAFQCPLLSLPLAFRTDLGSIPAEPHYLVPDQQRVQAWQTRLGMRTGMRVGLVWAGNPTLGNDRTRSVSLQMLTRLAIPGVHLISLQKELRDGDREFLAAHPEIFHLGDELTDFADTAAVMASLDLVISVDTAAAHLAGALGRPVWILQRFAPDFRWLLDREDSPWYPSARLFRQPRFGDWDSVIDQLALALAPTLQR
jgi:tetratricopeptide (TPR) repeat protein